MKISQLATNKSVPMTTERSKKLRILVVDDEPDNLDLLYRTFRRDFQVLKADSGVHALEKLDVEGEVAVIISDQRMPEMKGTEFLSKTVPQFPDTVRIILTGFTDIEDLVEAINAGQVYKYITKPWDPEELRGVVQRAAETYDVLKQRTEELRRAHIQMQLLTVLVNVSQATSHLNDTLIPIAKAFCETLAADGCIVQLVEAGNLIESKGTYGDLGAVENSLSQDPLTTQAIATREMQSCLNIPKDPTLSSLDYYQATGTQAHLVIPIKYRETVLGVLSLQWDHPCNLGEDEIKLIHLSVELVAIALASNSYNKTNE
ncbi:response regulator [Cronbergia sp. UHCC 0137]|uniref:response regulator n=1 Tax=Cronbergia sp. UHCC 0137 TaxID=3110239 RepID=UPI002B20A74D|nr:response regulator [Cronbergia sp. UHCC 0137]MEA5618201.1 response regulator [Cronbergia sp. UHCC 0137]